MRGGRGSDGYSLQAPLSPPSAAHFGRSDLFLLEGDEYPSSNTDNRSKFLHYHPSHVLLTPLAHDHVNVFPTVPEYLAPFHQLIGMVPEDGVIVASTGGELSAEFLVRQARPIVSVTMTPTRRPVARCTASTYIPTCCE